MKPRYGAFNRPITTARPDFAGLDALREEEKARAEMSRRAMAQGFEARDPSGSFELQRNKEIEAKAQFDASQFEKRYTAKQKVEIARLNKSKQDLENNPNFSAQERIAAARAIDLQLIGVKPADLPKLSPFPDGHGIGDSWEENGGVVRRDEKGIKAIMFRPDQMPAWQNRQRELDIAKTQDANALKRESKIMDFRMKIATQEVPERVKGPDGKIETTYRLRTPAEVDAILQSVSGGAAPGAQPQPAGQQPENEQPWYERAKSTGYNVTESDAKLPQQAGFSRAYLRTMNERYGEFKNVPAHMKDAYREAYRLLKQYASQGGMERRPASNL